MRGGVREDGQGIAFRAVLGEDIDDAIAVVHKGSVAGGLSEDEGAEHPPDEEEGDDGEQDMGEPLAGRLRSAESKHPAMVAGPRARARPEG